MKWDDFRSSKYLDLASRDNKISKKVKEHYGIEVPTSSAQNITEGHADKIKGDEDIHGHFPARKGTECLICETDGTMVPIVDVSDRVGEEKVLDKRKTRSVRWKECRLTLARKKSETKPVFGGTMGSADEAGDHWFDCAIRAGLGEKTKVHCVGDGATWITDQIDRVFGKWKSGTVKLLLTPHNLQMYISWK